MRRVQFRGYCAKADCGKPVFSRFQKTKYCSVECAKARYGASGKARRVKPFDSNARLKKPLGGACYSCGAVVGSAKRKYCSLACRRTYQFQLRARALENGTYVAYNCNRFVRQYLILKIGERCSRCGWNERHPKTGRVMIEVEHIDGDWRNNRPENLTLLCPNCHSLTPTFRGFNRGRGRAERLGGRENPLRPSSSRGQAEQPQQIDDVRPA